jgi:lipopolysaccharide biosynthesis glycosyltransferase
MKTVIPLLFAFDNNFIIPAAVALYSLLDNCNRNFDYRLYVLHSDITVDNQTKLRKTIELFSDFSTLEFTQIDHSFDYLWKNLGLKAHFSKEGIYKTILLSSLFPNYDKIIVSDVDVVFLGDISRSYFMIDVNDDIYLAGVKPVGKILSYWQTYNISFTEEEIRRLSHFCGGYLVYNLRKMRNDKMEEKFLYCFKNEGYRIRQMEQDVLNLCCYPKVGFLPLNYVACTYIWDLYKDDIDYISDINYSKEELLDAMMNPMQIHYAGTTKPWNTNNCTKSEEWFRYLKMTPFSIEDIQNIKNNIELQPQKPVRTVNLNLVKKIIDYIKRNPILFIKLSFYKRIIAIIKQYTSEG